MPDACLQAERSSRSAAEIIAVARSDVADGGASSFFRRADRFFYRLTYGERCVLCNKRIRKGRICPECIVSAPYVSFPRCLLCGESKKQCGCGGRARFYSGVTAPFYYEGVARTGISAWKFSRARNGDFYAAAMLKCIKKDFEGVSFDCVCFVPQTKKEFKLAGSRSTAQELAREIARLEGIECAALLKKLFETKRQRTLPSYLKSGNVFGVFSCPNEELVRGRTVLLVDDVKTSGSTLNECAKMLLLSGAEAVYCACAAVARRKRPRDGKN